MQECIIVIIIESILVFFFVFSDTVSRSGMFCAISNAIDQCNTESLIDVFQATKAVRIYKPGSVSSLVSIRQQQLILK